MSTYHVPSSPPPSHPPHPLRLNSHINIYIGKIMIMRIVEHRFRVHWQFEKVCSLEDELKVAIASIPIEIDSDTGKGQWEGIPCSGLQLELRPGSGQGLDTIFTNQYSNYEELEPQPTRTCSIQDVESHCQLYKKPKLTVIREILQVSYNQLERTSTHKPPAGVHFLTDQLSLTIQTGTSFPGVFLDIPGHSFFNPTYTFYQDSKE